MADYNRDEMRRQELRITSAEPKKKPTEKVDIELWQMKNNQFQQIGVKI